MVMMIKNKLVYSSNSGSSNNNSSKMNKVYLKLFIINKYKN